MTVKSVMAEAAIAKTDNIILFFCISLEIIIFQPILKIHAMMKMNMFTAS